MIEEKPIFITFEGGEGSGKTTQAKLLKERMEKEGLKTFLTKEPGGTEVGEIIRSFLLNTEHQLSAWMEYLLFNAARVPHVELIISKLNDGFNVICDRFSDATKAYQIFGRGLEIKNSILLEIDRISRQNLVPNLTFLLDIDPKVGLERVTKRASFKTRFDREDLDFHQRVRTGYFILAKEEPKRFRVVNAEGSIEEITQKIWHEVKGAI